MSVHTFDTMGTIVSVRVDDELGLVDLEAVRAVFQRYDGVYSLYDDASPLSRVAGGELQLADTMPDVRETYAQALEWRNATWGLSTPHRPDDVIDLSGLVKALAIRDAGAVLDGLGAAWLLTVGGDCLSRITPSTPTWRVGIVDPDDAAGLLGIATLDGSRRALATSGIAERGDHIWSRNGRSHFVQATVLADDIETADVLATTIIAGLPGDLDRVTETWNVDVLVVDRDGEIRATPRAAEWVSRPTSVVG
ncbi:hypothetical protein GCM10025867_08070 [Frondihabitans sucicola]|uniref:FAD:protein FMN transferase n=1 Tax=Frondihabitans sucicola TaxID=1268041 RepID=A0ABM8GK54_9MICO|nr:FAD:protein FMN transferase [Frondihabitans sucicola]BDZ48566.1 hypothetical protein GCM10025867_08070 [Frondihabitans sucicola]